MQTRFSHAGLAVGAALLALSLAACNGAANSALGGITNSNAYIRVLDGSPDIGTVDLAIDGRLIKSSAVYGNVTTYQSVTGGTTHAVDVYAPGADTGSGVIAPTTVGVNGGYDYTVVISGEEHPSYQTSANVGGTIFTESPFSTPSGGASVNFHNAAPFAASALGYGAANVAFGYSIDNAPTNNQVGTSQPLDGQTGVQAAGLPSDALNTPITFYAFNDTTVTTSPSQISTSCTSNQVPCTAPNLSLYLVDGPAASTAPNVPSTYSSTAKAYFFGAFDGNGLLTQ